MSMLRDCSIYKATDGQWYMDLAHQEYGEVEETFGPFVSEDAANDYLHDNYCNPGGYSRSTDGSIPVPTTSPNGRPVTVPVKRSRIHW